MSLSKLDAGQVAQEVYDVATDAIKVNIVAGGSSSGSTSIQDGVSSAIKATVTGANALKVDGSAVTQPVSASALPLPTGAATAANQSTQITSLTSIDTKTPALVTGRVPVDGSGVTQPVSGSVSVSNFPATQAISAAALPLPTGAATAAKQPALGTAGTPSADVLTVQGAASMTALKVDGSAVTQPISASALPLPTGAATAANQATANTSLASIDSKLGANTDVKAVVRNDYSSTPVTTSAWTALVTSTAAAYTYIEIFDSSGQTLQIGIGGAGSEVTKLYVIPGGNGLIPCQIASGTRVSIKAVSGNATAGEFTANFYG